MASISPQNGWRRTTVCFSPFLTPRKLISWRATCSFGPLLIGVFLNTILYGVSHFSLTQPGCALTRTYRFFSCRFGSFFYIIWFPSPSFKYIDVHLLSVVQEARPVLCSHHRRTHILHWQPEKLHGSDTSYVIPLWLEYSHLWPSPGAVPVHCRDPEHLFRHHAGLWAPYNSLRCVLRIMQFHFHLIAHKIGLLSHCSCNHYCSNE